jgi:CspA family cold shock protein
MVEFLASVIGALAAGALAHAGDIGGRVVADAYDALRALIVHKLGKSGAVQSVEDEPRSESAQVALAEALTKAGLSADPEIARHAEVLRVAVAGAAAAGGADIEVGAIVGDAHVLVNNLVATGRIKLGDLRAETGDATLTNLTAGTVPKERAKRDITMPIGKVKWFNPQKGYGFIQPEDGSKDVFVHISAVERAGMGSLNEGQRVSFEVERGTGSTSAVNLRIDDDVEATTTRTIDANFFSDRFVAGEMATLTITIRLPHNPTRGRWQGTATFAPELGPIQIMLEVHGFTLVSELPPPLEVAKDSDTAPVAFELRIDEASHRWLHVMLVQKGRSVGELIINDFSAVGQSPAHQVARSAVRSVAEADLMLVVRADEGRVEACSPSDRASLDHVSITGFKYPEIPFRELLADRLRALYDSRSDPTETARELQIVGVELAACLPADLVKLLRRRDIQSVMLRHEDDFDFPLELCYLDDPHDPFFIGDRIAVCRWYLGVTSLPDIISKRVRRVAFLKGSDEAFKADEILLNRLYPNRTVTFARRQDIINNLFKTSDFDLIHFTGHCRQRDKASGGLELADGKFLRLIEIGRLESERTFAAAQPFVMLNACASVQPYLGLTQRGSFAHRFVTSRACAVVGTLWPVAGPVANEFVERFYTELATKPIGQALLATKLALVRDDAGTRDGSEEASLLRRLARQVAVRSYCLFANPDLCLVA